MHGCLPHWLHLLPGNVILYSYVNCDALAMCSTAIIFIPGSRRIRKDGTGQLVQCLPLEWAAVSCRITMRMDLSPDDIFSFFGTMLTDQKKVPKEAFGKR